MTNKDLAALVAAQSDVIATLRGEVATLTAAIAAAPVKGAARSTVTIADRRASDTFVCTAHGGTCGLAKNGHFATKNGFAFHTKRS